MIQIIYGLLSQNLQFRIGGPMPAVGEVADCAPTAPIIRASSCTVCGSLLTNSDPAFSADLSQNVFLVDDGQEVLCLSERV